MNLGLLNPNPKNTHQKFFCSESVCKERRNCMG